MYYIILDSVAGAATEPGSEAEEATAGCPQPWGTGRGLAAGSWELCCLAWRSVCVSQPLCPERGSALAFSRPSWGSLSISVTKSPQTGG